MLFDILGINILSAILGGLVIYYFCYSHYEIDSSPSRMVGFLLAFGFINGIVSSYMLQSGDIYNLIKPLLLFITSVAIIRAILRTKLYQASIIFLIYAISLGVGNSFQPLLINLSSNSFTTASIQTNPLSLLIVNTVSNTVAGIIIVIIILLKNYGSKILVHKENLPILFITFLVLTANFGMHYYIKIFNFTALIIISFLSILYCTYIFIVSTQITRNETARLEIEQQKFYNESLNSTLFNLRRFKHDWSNNLTVIHSMLTMNKINELKQYLSELISQSLEEGNTAIYNIKNAGLFGIISAKLNQARDLGVAINISVVGEVENIPGIKISELCEVIGIFLDNAIEETCKGEKKIEIHIFSDESYLEITISNSCKNEPDMKMIYEAGYSSKGSNRGMGLAIAKKIIGKYKNILHISDYGDNTFTQTLTIEKGL